MTQFPSPSKWLAEIQSWHVSGALQVSGVNETVVGGPSLERRMASNNFSELGLLYGIP